MRSRNGRRPSAAAIAGTSSRSGNGSSASSSAAAEAVASHSASVRALTDARGVAKFTIHSSVGGSNPVYFEANLTKATSSYPYGYSPILAVRFRK
jgi:hypothetical protein